MNISNCHFATASGCGFRLGFGFGFGCFALAICGQFAGNRRQPVNWKVSCNYKTFFIILWHSLFVVVVCSQRCSFCCCCCFSCSCWYFVSLCIQFWPSCRWRANVFATGSQPARTVTETDPTHVWPKLKWKWEWKMRAAKWEMVNGKWEMGNALALDSKQKWQCHSQRQYVCNVSYECCVCTFVFLSVCACVCVCVGVCGNAKLISFCLCNKAKWQLQNAKAFNMNFIKCTPNANGNFLFFPLPVPLAVPVSVLFQLFLLLLLLATI